METIDIKSRPENFRELAQFQLSTDDAYDARCGEVFITLNRVLVFHCSLCDNKYGSSDYFLEHLSAQHYKDMQEEIIEIETETEGSETDGTKGVFVDYSYDDSTREQDDGDIEEETLDKIEVSLQENKPSYVQTIEEEYLEDVERLEIDIEQFQAEYEELSLDKIKEEMENEEDRVLSISEHTEYEIEFQKRANIYKCDSCDKMFESRTKLKKHSITHSSERKHKCKICGFAFKERSNLNAHLKRHSGVKKISCELCDKKFFTRTEAATHQRTHTGERPFVCSYCGTAFGTSGALNEHVKRHNNIRPHKCPHCDKRFYDSCQLRDHMPVHTNERPFVCAICSASFARLKSLRVHTKLHINAKEYACSLCEKCFNQKPALLTHIKTHHKVVDSH